MQGFVPGIQCTLHDTVCQVGLAAWSAKDFIRRFWRVGFDQIMGDSVRLDDARKELRTAARGSSLGLFVQGYQAEA
jgi:hypothetical protein